MMIARATCDMAQGTEITWWYKVPSGNDYLQRKE